MIRVEVQEKPVAQGRPRFARQGQHVIAYDPPASKAYKQLVAISARTAMTSREPLTGPLKVTVYIYRQIQKNGSKALKMAKINGEILPTVKPDVDNYYKAVTDACTGIVWQDDNQIIDGRTIKKYSDNPRMIMEVEEIKCLKNKTDHFS